MEIGFEILIILFMLTFNAVFAAYEMALASVSLTRLHALAKGKASGAKAAVFMKEKMERSLAVVQLGITIVGAVAAATGGAGVQDTLVPWMQENWRFSENTAEAVGVMLLVLPLSAVTILFGELLPKVFAIRNHEWVCLRLSPAMQVFSVLTLPLTRLFEGAVKFLLGFGKPVVGADGNAETGTQIMKDLQSTAEMARASRLITPREESIMLRAAELSSRPASETMIPAEDAVTIPAEADLTEALLRAHKDMHSRFPVCSVPQDPQSILGYVNFKDIVTALKTNPRDPSVRGITRKILVVRETDSLSTILERMIRDRIHIASVQNQTGAVRGILTLEDIVALLVGRIESEYDRLPGHLHAGAGNWIAGGGIKMAVLEAQAGFPPTGEGDRTLSDWLEARLGRPPESGESFSFEDWEFQVRKLRRKKLAEAVLRPAAFSANK